MPGQTLRIIGIILLTAGFVIWAYGFVYSSFWYANSAMSLLEPVRLWISQLTGQPVLPGVIEEVLGLAAALVGIVLQMITYVGKK